MAPWLRTPPIAIIWLTRLGILSPRWTRLKYMQKPLQWVVDPKTLPREERMAVENTDLWTLSPGSYEPHNIGFKRVMVLRSRRHLENDLVMVCTWKGMFEQVDKLSDHYRDKQEYKVVGKYCREYSSVIPGRVLAVDEAGPDDGVAMDDGAQKATKETVTAV